MSQQYPDEWPYFFTATILKWKHVLKDDCCKDIIIDALGYAVEQERTRLFAYVIMSNHIHLVWQPLPPYSKQVIQLGFMKYAAQKIKHRLQQTNPELLEQFKVDKGDREYQIWKRRPLSVELFSSSVFRQKIDYIHNNPVRAGLCNFAEEYKYS